jgi:hypothetical protein
MVSPGTKGSLAFSEALKKSSLECKAHVPVLLPTVGPSYQHFLNTKTPPGDLPGFSRIAGSLGIIGSLAVRQPPRNQDDL